MRGRWRQGARSRARGGLTTLAVVGVASYSLYLWHVPVIKALIDGGVSTGFAALTLIAVPIRLLVAIGSYAAIESPFLRLRRQWARSSAEQEPRLSRHA